MKSTHIEFCLLQAVLCYVTDERVTIGLVHWDGTTLRWAFNPDKLPESFKATPKVAAFVNTLRSKLEKGLGLVQIQSITETDDKHILVWSDLKTSRTRDAKKHFEEAATSLGIRRK